MKKKGQVIFDEVKIGPNIYTVTVESKLFNEDNEPLWGQCNSGYCAIKLVEDIPPAKFKEIYLHELVHAILDDFLAGKMFFDNNKDKEESFVACFTPRLLSFLKDNPGTIKKLT